MIRRLLVLVMCLGISASAAYTISPQEPQTPQEQPKQAEAPKAEAPKADETKAAAKQAGKNPDEQFAVKAAMANQAEIELGQLALEKAASPDVKAFAQQMIDGHSKTLEELKQTAMTKTIPIAATLDRSHQATKDKLAKLTGAEFDRTYMNEMIKAHGEAVNLFEKEASQGKDADLKAWAAGKLPTIKEHQTMANEVGAKVGANRAAAKTADKPADTEKKPDAKPENKPPSN